VSQTGLIFSLKVSVNFISNLLNVFSSNNSFCNQLVGVLLRRSLPISDGFIHDRLSETGFIKLVMAVETVSNHITQSVFSVLLPVSNHEFARLNDSLRIACVHSKHRNTERLDDVRGSSETSIVSGVGSETQLIVSD
jgi:hypothetical protein